MCKGFIRIPRRLLETKWWNRKRVLSENEAVVNLYQRADRQGAIATSIRSLAVEWGWEQTKVFRFLTKLEKDKFISSTKLRNGTVIKILDFGEGATQSTTQSATPKGAETKAFHDEYATPSATQSAIPRAYKNDNIFISSLKEEFKQPPLSPQGGKSSYDWSLLSEPMKLIAMQWLEYKKEKKQTYKPTGFKAFCKRLIKLSGGDPLKAQQIIDYSMSNNYSGIFELNNHATTQTTQQPYHDSDHPTTEQLRQQTAAYIASRLAQD